MQQLRSATLIGLLILGILTVGCEGGPPADPPGKDAKSGKVYTPEDANKAQPVRGKVEETEEKGR